MARYMRVTRREIKADGTQEYPAAHFWEAVCQPDAWLRIFHSFVYVEKKDVVIFRATGRRKKPLIFRASTNGRQ